MGNGRVIPDGYRIDRGLLWPATDVAGPAIMYAGASGLEEVYKHCRGFDVAIQAGGHCGVWPATMGLKFKTVYTFEPDPMNFRCLCANAPAENVVKFNAALGPDHRRVGMHRRPENVGATYIDGEGSIVTMRVDDLGIGACDLIYLDVEGYEMPVLHGAQGTIEECSPVIVVEDKGCSERYGFLRGEVEAWLAENFGYRVVERIHRDVVLAP